MGKMSIMLIINHFRNLWENGIIYPTLEPIADLNKLYVQSRILAIIKTPSIIIFISFKITQ